MSKSRYSEGRPTPPLNRVKAKGRMRGDALFRLLVSGIKDYAIFMLDPAGHVVSWNEGAERIKGYTAEEIVGQHFSKFYPPEDAARNEPAKELQQAIAQGRFETEGWRLRKDGSRFWADVVITPIYGETGELTGFGKVTRDMTEQKTNDEVMRASLERVTAAEAKFRRLVELAPEGIVIADHEGHIQLVNRQTVHLFGYQESELLNQPVEMLIPERFRNAHASHRSDYAAAPRIRPMGGGMELYGRRKDGSEFPVEISLSPMEMAGEFHVMSLIHDMTSHKEREEQIKRLNLALQQRAAELEVSNKELEAFSYSVSHDLRAPLRSIDGFSRVLLEDYTDKLDNAGQDFLHRVCDSCQYMARLIDDLLKLSRITRTEICRETVNLSDLTREIARRLQEAHPDRVVEWRITPDLTVQGDRRLLRAALENLLSNAWKFTGKREKAIIELGVSQTDADRVYFVRDNGAGFDMAYVDKLFGAFQRLHSAQEFEGIGVGLATVQRIIHRHGGRVWANGVVEEGATFYFTL